NLVTLDSRAEQWLWKTSAGLRRFGTTHVGLVQSVSFAPGGSSDYLSTGWDRTLRYWSASKKRSEVVATFGSTVWNADWSPDGKYFAAGSNNGAVRIFAADTRREVASLPKIHSIFSTVFFSGDSRRLFVMGVPMLYEYSIPGFRLLSQRPMGVSNNNGGATAQSRTHVFSLTPRGPELIDLSTGKTLPLHLKAPKGVKFISCAALRGNTLYCQDRALALYVYRYPSLEPIATLAGHTDFIASARLHPKGEWFLSSADDRTLRVWDLKSGRPLLIFTDMGSQFLQVTEDGRHLYFSDPIQVTGIPLDLSLQQMDPGVLLEKTQKMAGLCLDGVHLKPASLCSPKKSP
ncbi:hypothetical protein KKF84_01435, partial [Myxococcota bacterium]|nr:hypothetical protein [Myxococcota bacterium]MBU1533947.1 hypothetical protein [Myxococcota bacterium]